MTTRTAGTDLTNRGLKHALAAIALMLSVLPWGYAQGQGTTIYVSPAGSDDWSGALEAPTANRTDGPFATIARARDAVRALKARGPLSEPVTVELRGGTHYLPGTLAFTPEDSGTEGCPITYRSFPGETAVLSGGGPISGWREVPGPGPRRWETRLAEVESGQWTFRQLFVRHAGEGFFTRRFRPSKGMLVVADLTWSPARKSVAHRAAQPDFIFFPGDLRQWENMDDVELVALHSWSASRLKIAGLDTDKRIVTLSSVPTFRIGHWYRDGRNPYYVENVKEELREPGQWYLDRPSGILTYLPLPGESLDDTLMVAPRLERLVTVTGDLKAPQTVEHLRFERLGLAHSEWPLPPDGYDTSQGQPTLSAAVEVTAARAVRFERCTVANTGAYGIGLGLGCQQCEVAGCLMYDLGGGGVKVGDSAMDQGAVLPELPTGNAVRDNTITDTGMVHYSANGIWCGITRNTAVLHNEVRNNPYTGIAVGWCWGPDPTSCGGNTIEGNHVHHVMQLVQDGGGIYTLGRQPGTVIQGNLVHDSLPSPFACGPGTSGLYFDEGSSGFTVEDNIQYDVAWSPGQIDHNQNTASDHDIRTNYLGIRPDEPGFPQALAAQAGVREGWRWPAGDMPRITPNPVYAMTLEQAPALPPGFDLSFDQIPVGDLPHGFAANGATDAATIGVTDEVAQGRARCLQFQDRRGLARPYYPYLSRFDLHVATGPVELSFDLRQDPTAPARLWVELRDYDTEQKAEFYGGPSVVILADGAVRVGERDVTAIPAGQWAHVVVRFALGADAAKEWDLTVSLPDGSSTSARFPFGSTSFRTLTGLIMSADADADGAAFVDNLRLKAQ
jgi:hypothetical protein